MLCIKSVDWECKAHARWRGMRVPAIIYLLYAGLTVAVILGARVPGAAAQSDLTEQVTIGFKQVRHADVDVDIWYPSHGPITQTRHGPFPVKYATNGTPVGEALSVVVLSHGMGGRPRNHHLTAAALVADGHVVIAPTHENDWLVTDGRLILALERRVFDLAAALAAVNKDVVLARHLDVSNVKGVGYSLGTASIMIAAGAAFDREQLRDHCARWGEDDPEFCRHITPPWWRRVLTWLRRTSNEQDSFAVAAPIISGDISLVAPIGQGMDLSRLNSGPAQIQLLSLGQDAMLPPRFHAKVLLSRLGVEKINYQHYAGVHHYAFIAPFPEWILEQEDIPVADDPPGFERTIFLQRVNRDIALFLRD